MMIHKKVKLIHQSNQAYSLFIKIDLLILNLLFRANKLWLAEMKIQQQVSLFINRLLEMDLKVLAWLLRNLNQRKIKKDCWVWGEKPNLYSKFHKMQLLDNSFRFSLHLIDLGKKNQDSHFQMCVIKLAFKL